MKITMYLKKIIKYFFRFLKDVEVILASTIAVIKTLVAGKRSIPCKNEQIKKVLVLGNGPSLNEIDFNEVDAGIEIACVNFYALKNPNFMRIKPGYYCLADPIFFGSKKNLREDIQKLYDIFDNISWPMKLIVPQKALVPISNKQIILEYLPQQNIGNEHLSKLINHLYSRNLLKCGWQNVAIGLLHYLCMKKAETIYIAGIDMSEFTSYSIDENNHVIAEFTHFYGNEKDDRTKSGDIPQGEFGTWLGKYAKMLTEFVYISRFASFQKVTIKNLSLHSYVDIFPKEHWSIIQKKERR